MHIDTHQKSEQVEEEQEENVRNLIQESNEKGGSSNVAKYDEVQSTNVIHCKPEPYIIVDVLEEKEVITKDFDGVILSISQLGCLYTISKPTGTGNLSLPPTLFKRG